MKVSYEGIGQLCASFTGSGLSVGTPVKITANGTAAARRMLAPWTETDGFAFRGVRG